MDYKYIDDVKRDQTVAIGVYHGKTVKAYAHKHPQDTYDPEKGRALATAKLDLKIARKREKASVNHLRQLRAEREALSRKLTNLDYKIITSSAALGDIRKDVDESVEVLKNVLKDA